MVHCLTNEINLCLDFSVPVTFLKSRNIAYKHSQSSNSNIVRKVKRIEWPPSKRGWNPVYLTD